MKKRILCTILFLTTAIATLQLQSKEVNLTKNKSLSLQIGDELNLNSSTEFVHTNDNIYYKIVKSGSGKPAFKGEDVKVHYRGWLLKQKKNDKNHAVYFVGPEFDSSHSRNQPFTFKLGMRQVISGWDKMVSTMKKGEVRIVVLPSKEAYGSRATGSIPADSSLIFEIEFISAS